MSERIAMTPRVRALYRLHRREAAGQAGRLALPMSLLRIVLLVVLAARLWTMTGAWDALPAADMERRLWLLMGGSWLGVALLAALTTLQTAMARQEIGLMLPLPLDSTARWRLVLWRAASSFGLLIVGGVLAIAAALGRFGFDWTITYLLWLPASVCLGVLLPLVIAWLGNGGHLRRRAMLVAIGMLAALGTMIALTARQPERSSLPPLALIPDALLITGATAGFAARWLGRWYLRLAQALVTAPRRARDYLGPLSRTLGALLARWRAPWAAIALKELRVQARDVFVLLRIAVMLGALPLFIALEPHLPAWAGEASTLPAAFALVLAVYAAIETTPSPLGGEGNRLTLVLLHGVPPRDLIAGKALAVTAPLIAQMWIMAGLVVAWRDAPPVTVATALLTATIAVAAIGTVLTCLSAGDIDLRQPVESATQALLVEHVPASPRRLATLGVTLALAAGAAGAILTLPWPASLAAIGPAGFVVTAAASRYARHRLSRITAA